MLIYDQYLLPDLSKNVGIKGLSHQLYLYVLFRGDNIVAVSVIIISAAGLHVVSAVVIVRCIRNISCISDIFPVGKGFTDGFSGYVIVGLFMLVTVLAAFFDVCRAAAV